MEAYAHFLGFPQIFESVETTEQIKPVPTCEAPGRHSSSPDKDIPNGSGEVPRLSQEVEETQKPPPDSGSLVSEPANESANSQMSATEEASAEPLPTSKSGEESVTEDNVSLKTKMSNEVGAIQKGSDNVSTTSKLSEAQDNGSVEEKEILTNSHSTDLNDVGTNINSRLITETTNVLKLETEIHNEYFQAPPLGQTLTLQAKTFKTFVAEPTSEKETKSSDGTVSSQLINTCFPESKKKDTEPAASDSETIKDKAAEISCEKPGSNSPVRQVLHALQSASRGSLSLSRQSPDTADSDDSPSALEMEDIPAGITCVTSQDNRTRPLAGLAAPPLKLAQRMKAASEELVPDHHLDTPCNTSPEGTDLGLSEEEPEMENVLAGPKSSDAEEVIEHNESSEEQAYSVST